MQKKPIKIGQESYSHQMEQEIYQKMKERTFVLIKHDGVAKGLIGEIISRFERIGLKIVGLKMLLVDEELAKNHYKVTKEWATNLFDKSKKAAEKNGKKFPFKDPIEYGKMIQAWNQEYLREGPIVAIVFEGPHAVEIIRKMVGHTEPRQALPGTIRGDYIIDSYDFADRHKRSIRNLIHASENLQEADREIGLWFKKEELVH
ncbi:MAG: nucleoside-diphosphate kinase [Nanoarchaeota archaeon]